SDGKRRRIRLVKVLEEMAAVVPEAAVRPVKAKELGQLCAREEKGHAALEAGHDAFGNEVDDRARLGEPRDEGNDRDEHGGARAQRCKAAGVAPGRVSSPSRA